MWCLETWIGQLSLAVHSVINSSIHDLHGRPADSQAAKSSWNIGRPSSKQACWRKIIITIYNHDYTYIYVYKYHTLGKQVWMNASSFHQFSNLRETACEGYKSHGKSQSLHLQTLWDQASYRVSFAMTAMASFFGVVTLHSRWTSLSVWEIWTNL